MHTARSPSSDDRANGSNDARPASQHRSNVMHTGSADAGKHGHEIGVVSDDDSSRSADHEDMIVVGIDGSEGAARALEFAAKEATLRRRGLRVVAVWHVPMPAYSGGMLAPTFSIDEFEHSMKAAADRQVSEVLAGYPDLPHELVVHEGNAAQVLLQRDRVERTCLCSVLAVGRSSVGCCSVRRAAVRSTMRPAGGHRSTAGG